MMRLLDFWREQRAAATVELALILGLLTIPLLNTVDLGFYAYQRMQVENAAQTGAQAAWSACNTTSLQGPAATNCTGLSSAVSNAIRATSLGSSVTLASGSPAEGYYCTTTTGAILQVAASPSTAANKCSTYTAPGGATWVSSGADIAGDYVSVSVTYSFSSLFPGVSVAALLPSPITKTVVTRLG